jgi:ectoine hydroxylase-related dioxygenase (phytanoyl-CoA dioxygenase family)
MWQSEIIDSGFATIPDVLRGNEVSSFLASLSCCALPRTKAGIRHMLRDQAASAIAHDPRLMRIAGEILGPNVFPFVATLFDKSPRANWLVVWHQDRALPLQKKVEVAGWGPWSVKQGVTYAHAPASALEKVLALRLHLDDSTSENGPLCILPGTHQRGVLSDHVIQEIARSVGATDCVVAKGGVLAMRPLVIHSSSKSETFAPRRVLHIEYAAASNIAEGLTLARA